MYRVKCVSWPYIEASEAACSISLSTTCRPLISYINHAINSFIISNCYDESWNEVGWLSKSYLVST